jgi:chitin synthase
MFGLSASTTTLPAYQFLDSDLVAIFQVQRSGQDVTAPMNAVLETMNSTYKAQNMACLNNLFVVGSPDFRKSARCQVELVVDLFFGIAYSFYCVEMYVVFCL